MPREVLSLQTIGEVDNGAIRVAFDQELRKVLLDLEDRPDLNKPRRLILTLDLRPVAQQGHLTRTDVAFSVKAAIPQKASVSYPMHPTRNGLTFQPEIADNPAQEPLPFTEDDDQ